MFAVAASSGAALPYFMTRICIGGTLAKDASFTFKLLPWVVAESDGQPVIGIHQPDRDRQVGQFLFRERRRRRLEFAIRYSGVGDARDCFSPSQSRTFA